MRRINIFTVELVKESGKLYDLENVVIKSPEDGYKVVEKVFDLSGKTKEHFGILSLSTKGQVIGAHIIHIGGLNVSIVGARDIFQQAILNNAHSIILFHNHPSGIPTPSPEDISVTERMIAGGNILGIDVIDHLIIGHDTFTSLREKGYMDEKK